MNTKSIIELNAQEIRNYMLDSDNYCTLELPEYYNFGPILEYVQSVIEGKTYAECKSGVDMSGLQNVNHTILLNKDGRYGVRPLTIANPFSYCFLVREMFDEKNWTAIKDCFDKFKLKNFACPSIPVVVEGREDFHMAGTILNSWWKQFEQKSIEQSLYYKYMFVTDITNCYGCILPQSIDWALSLKGTEFETEDNKVLANNIIEIIRDMQSGRNVGIPQGSAIFDLIGEILLGYSDLLLHNAIASKGITDGYLVLRYRDDYRIFCNEKDKLEDISYVLQEVLESLNLRMNTQKTRISNSIVTDSVKQDKLDYIYNTPISSKYSYDFDGLQKHLMFILLFARKHPNSGYLKTILNDFDKRVKAKLEGRDKTLEEIMLNFSELYLGTNDKSVVIECFANAIKDRFTKNSEVDSEEKGQGANHKPIDLTSHIKAIIAIAITLAMENIPACPNVMQIIGHMAKVMGVGSDKWWNVMDLVYKRLSNLPNSDYPQIWLQNLTYAHDVLLGQSPYVQALCKLTMREPATIWDNSWLKEDLTKGFPLNSIVDYDILSSTAGEIKILGRKAVYDQYSMIL